MNKFKKILAVVFTVTVILSMNTLASVKDTTVKLGENYNQASIAITRSGNSTAPAYAHIQYDEK